MSPVRSFLPLAFFALAFAACEPPVDPCAGVACGAGRCVADRGRPACQCQTGFAPVGLTCTIENQASDPCAHEVCAGTGRICVAVSGNAQCQCSPGFREVNSACVRADVCSPNPCTALHQTTCSEGPTGAICACEAGYVPEGTGCSAQRVFDCSKQHAGDDFEPNECPTQAQPLDLGGGAQSHSISSAGDEDWIYLATPVGHVVQVAVTGSTIPLYLDVYGSRGLSAVAADHRGVATPDFRFVATQEALYLRVRALRGNDTGPYTLTAADLGVDDYADSAATARTVSPGSSFVGAVQYPGDDDYLRVSVQAGHAYALELSSGSSTSVAVDVFGLDGQSLIASLDRGATASLKVVTHPSAAGAYLLHARGASRESLGDYNVSLTDLGLDDHGDTQSEASSVLAAGNLTPASFERASDIDVLSFPVVAGHIYALTCTTSGSTGCKVSLRDATGTVLGSNSSSSSARVTAEAASASTWYVSLAPYYSSSFGAYAWKLEDLGPDDFGDTLTAASPGTLGTQVNGMIELPGDADVFSFTAPAGHIVQAACTPSTALSGCSMTIHDASGATVVSSTSAATGFLASSAGRYYLTVKASYSSYSGSYTLLVSDGGTDDHGGTTSSATTLTPGSPTAGSIQYGSDKDVFTFTATAAHIYKVACTSSSSSVCGLTVRDASGLTVGSASTGTSTQVSFKASAATYSVEVSGYYSTSLGSYSITVSDTGVDDHGDTAATGTAITAGAAATSGQVQHPGDKDVFTFAATANQLYKFGCTSTSYNLCRLVARNPSGTTVASGYESTASQVSFKAAVSGTYSIEVSAYSTYTGSYSVQLSEVSDDFGDAAASAGTLTPGTTVSGNLEASGDQDWFAVDLAASTSYTVTTTGAYLYVAAYDPNGTTAIGYATYQTKSFTTTAAGTYYLKLSGYYSSTTGAYTVKVQ